MSWRALPKSLSGMQREATEAKDVLAGLENSATGTRTRVARVRAEYPNQLDYSGLVYLSLRMRLITLSMP